MKVLFLGYGRMGKAIGDAWHNAGLVEQISAIDPGQAEAGSATLYAHIDQLPAQRFDLIVLAVKPSYARSALETLPSTCFDNTVVLSVAAGVTCATLASAVEQQALIVRAMPNTPVLVNAGCTVLFANSPLPAALEQQLSQLFRKTGSAYWVEQEQLLDAVTAISGSGPAYYHLFSESLAQAGIALGLPEYLAHALAADTAHGASTLQIQPNANFQTLRSAVTSPNGTTAAAIEQFEVNDQLRALVLKAATAAFLRSHALSAELLEV